MEPLRTFHRRVSLPQRCSELHEECCFRRILSSGSIDRAFCPGVSEKSKETFTENGRETDSRIPEESNYYGEEEMKMTRIVGVALERGDMGLGITLRSGPPNQAGYRPLVITKIKQNGPADRDGTIKVGDRLLGIDGQRLTGLTLSEAERLLVAPNGGRPVWLSVEYDISIMTAMRAAGPLLVEIESPSGKTDLGLTLMDSISGVIVSSVRTASIAERCGAVLPGDQILAVNEYRIENLKISAARVMQILANTECKLYQIEILPVAAVSLGDVDIQLNSSMNSVSQECHDFNDNLDNFHYNHLGKQILEDDSPELKIESGIVTLNTTPGTGFGLIFRSAPSKKGAVICYIEPHGIADRSGVLQIGDRIQTINGKSADKYERLEDIAKLTVVITIQFDVEVHSCSEGPFSVTITRSEGSGFGITISGEYRKGVVISHIKWGSVAHRCGRLSVGDQLLGINGTDIRGDLSTALEIFKCSQTTVTFIVNRTSSDLGYSSPGLPSVDSAVESWDSSDIPNVQNDFQRQEFRDTWRTGTNESTNSFTSQHSDDETYSSLRLSESVLDAISAAQPNGLTRKPPSPPCPLQTNYRLRKVNLPTHWRGSSNINNSGLTSLEAEAITSHSDINTSPRTFRTFRGLSKDDENIQQPQQNVPQTVFQVTLTKNMVFEDFGFSVSDGLYEKGVFINSIKPGSPADQSKMLKPYDKIIQVNDVPTHDLDCCMTVPLMASAGQTLTLTVVRYQDRNSTNSQNSWIEEVGEEAGEALKLTETI
ncbi:glutamate receptor-interacting protein 1 isoform X2 [Halyomorpha halys]|uniref:glutamate receptor-interacting protein 1 isoform X2 n=1 Tax=Halyomorpha halys TaxID=286706 RepID=UPI0006D4D11B|nr:glutamate receptor-interacting protein 1 isoform X2 [Halyomorpha halys]